MITRKNSFYGFNPPFFGGPQNVMSKQFDDRLIKNDILQLLMTVPGERVMRPTFGTQLRSFVFEQADDSGLDSLANSIRYALIDQEPRIDVVDVTVDANEERNTITVSVIATLKRDPSKQIVVEQLLTLRA